MKKVKDSNIGLFEFVSSFKPQIREVHNTEVAMLIQSLRLSHNRGDVIVHQISNVNRLKIKK